MKHLTISNVVGGGDLHREFDLAQVYQDFQRKDKQYEPESFSGLVIRYQAPKATIILFSSGKYSLAGAKSEKSALEVNEIFITDLENLIGESLIRSEFEIRYLVCSGDLGYSVDLNKAITMLGIENIEYEPEQFPGLFFRPKNKDWFAIIFSSGSIVIDGSVAVEDLEQAYEEIRNELSSTTKQF